MLLYASALLDLLSRVFPRMGIVGNADASLRLRSCSYSAVTCQGDCQSTHAVAALPCKPRPSRCRCSVILAGRMGVTHVQATQPAGVEDCGHQHQFSALFGLPAQVVAIIFCPRLHQRQGSAEVNAHGAGACIEAPGSGAGGESHSRWFGQGIRQDYGRLLLQLPPAKGGLGSAADGTWICC